MQSVVQTEYGTEPEAVLSVADIATPVIGDGEVLVHVAAAGVDRGTWHVMAGLPAVARAAMGLRRPKYTNPGRALAGTIAAVGSRVTGFAVGDEVYGSCDSAFAELAAAHPKRLARKPSNLSFQEAATLPISAVTALQAVRTARVEPGQRVLVTGASGGVGSYAVQIAAARGAEVTGVCSTEKIDFVRGLGAQHVVDYTREDTLATSTRYDAIVDIAGHRRLRELRNAMTRRGSLVIVGSETGGHVLGGIDRSIRAQLLSPFVSQRLHMLVSSENTADLDELRELVEDKKVVAVVDREFRLSETAAALRYLIDGHARGKVVLAVS